ncbi:hypothetical protein ACLKA7_003323 [Drosophila subpalustris]
MRSCRVGFEGSRDAEIRAELSRVEKLLNINYVAHWFGFRLPFCIINCIRDKRRVIAIEIINSKGPDTRLMSSARCLSHASMDRMGVEQQEQEEMEEEREKLVVASVATATVTATSSLFPCSSVPCPPLLGIFSTCPVRLPVPESKAALSESRRLYLIRPGLFVTQGRHNQWSRF